MTVLQLVDLIGIGEGGALMIVGLLFMTLWAVVQFRNPLGAVMWGLTVMTLIFVGVFGVGSELFWIALMLTVVLVIVGAVARMTNGGR